MVFSPEAIKTALTGGGTRPTLFDIIVHNPFGTFVGDAKMKLTAKSTQLPSSDLGTITVNYFGRGVKYPGDTTYPEWTTTIINDEDFLVRNELEKWKHAINHNRLNIRHAGAGSGPRSYESLGQVIQYGKEGVPLKAYKFYNLWPSSISSIDVSWDSTDAIEEYSVTWQYDFWEADDLASVVANTVRNIV